MGLEDVYRKHVDERLECITKELLDIADIVPKGQLQERLSSLCGQIQKLVYESLKMPPQTFSEEHQKELSGLQSTERSVNHRINQASFGGVPELFMDEAPIHKHTVSFGGIRQLFDVETEVFEVGVPLLGVNNLAEENSANPLSPSPSYEGVDLLFKDGPLKGNANFDGVSDMFRKSEDKSRSASLTYEGVDRLFKDGPLMGKANFDGVSDMFRNPEDEKINMGREFNSDNSHHDRTISFGGVRQLGADEEFEDVDFGETYNQIDNGTGDKDAREGATEDAHNRGMSNGGVRQLIPVECDTFSDEEIEKTSPKVSIIVEKNEFGHDRTVSIGGVRQLKQDGLEEELLDLDRAAEMTSKKVSDIVPSGHDRTVSTGGVRQLQQDGFEDELLDLDNIAAEMTNNLRKEDEQSDAAEVEEEPAHGCSFDVEKDANLDDESQFHGRTVSHGGVKPLQDLEMDDLDEPRGSHETKPRQMVDDQGIVKNTQHERRRSNMQNVLEEGPVNVKVQRESDMYLESGNTLSEVRDLKMQTQNLKSKLQQLELSKFDLVKSTSVEINRLRGIINTRDIQLRHLTKDHKRLVIAMHSVQNAGVFGSFTNFFSAAPEPSHVYRVRM